MVFYYSYRNPNIRMCACACVCAHTRTCTHMHERVQGHILTGYMRLLQEGEGGRRKKSKMLLALKPQDRFQLDVFGSHKAPEMGWL